MKQKTKEDELLYVWNRKKVSGCDVRKVKCAKRIKYETFRKNGW